MLGEVCRRYIFWFLDFLNGRPVKKHLEDITTRMEHPELKCIAQEDLLIKMLHYAVAQVPFYKKYDPENGLAHFPVINKNIIKSDYAAFHSEEFLHQKVITLSTSGSTGTPFKVPQDKNKRNRCFAEMMYFWGITGYEIGMKYIYFRSWDSSNKKSRISAFSRNIIMLNVDDLEEETLERIRRLLIKNKKIKMLLGYASTLECLADYLDKFENRPNTYGIMSVIAISEALSDPAKEKLIKAFDCPVVSHYSNSENGVLAQEVISSSERIFHFNSASFILELLAFDSDTPVACGEPGRVVITDLYNHAMPLIRYDTGDIAIQQKDDANPSHVILSSIEGRKIDFVYNTNGKKISPHDISVNFWNFPEIRQYQFIQRSAANYEIKLNTVQDLKSEDAFIHSFKQLLGSDAQIQLQYVESIPTLKSGKRKYIVNDYIK